MGLPSGEGYIRLDEPVSSSFTLHRSALANMTRTEVPISGVMRLILHLTACYGCGDEASAD